jgi:hypothetical protein
MVMKNITTFYTTIDDMVVTYLVYSWASWHGESVTKNGLGYRYHLTHLFSSSNLSYIYSFLISALLE